MFAQMAVKVLVCLWLSGLLVATGNPGSAQPGAASTVEFARFSPVAIFNDGTDSTTLQVRVTGAAAQVRVRAPFLRADDQRELLDLFDDGTHGDPRPNDGVFTRAGITSTARRGFYGGVVVVVVDATGNTGEIYAYPDGIYFLISPDLRRPITARGNDLQTTDYIANFRDDGRLFKVESSISNTIPPDLQAVARAFYDRFPDEYDFLAVFTGVETAGGILFHEDVRNDVRGIGKMLFNNAGKFGSRGRLRGISFHGLSGAGGLVHELAHQWGVFLNDQLGLGDGTGHWGSVNIPGYLQGLDFMDNSNDTYTITWTRFGDSEGNAYRNRPFPPMELYLMGMMPAQEVPPMTVLRGVDANQVQAGDVVRPTGVRKVTIEEVVRVQGQRVPPAGTAPTAFRMAGILITPGRLAGEAEMALYSRFMEHFGSDEGSTLLDLGVERPSFGFATGGRGQMDTILGVLK